MSNTQKIETRKRLEAAAHAMAAAAEALELLGTPEARKHAEEMYGAMKMIEQWRMEMEEER